MKLNDGCEYYVKTKFSSEDYKKAISDWTLKLMGADTDAEYQAIYSQKPERDEFITLYTKQDAEDDDDSWLTEYRLDRPFNALF